jgi:hypothetical protein
MVKAMLMVVLLPVVAWADPGPHVRGTERQAEELIAQGLEQSATFRALVEALNESDLIVYVEPRRVRRGLGGYLTHSLHAREGYRYVRLVVNVEGSKARLIGVIAHELQHALEVARAPWVQRSEEVEPLFERIGFRAQSCPGGCYETSDAIAVGLRVHAEIGRRRERPVAQVASTAVGQP